MVGSVRGVTRPHLDFLQAGREVPFGAPRTVPFARDVSGAFAMAFPVGQTLPAVEGSGRVPTPGAGAAVARLASTLLPLAKRNLAGVAVLTLAGPALSRWLDDVGYQSVAVVEQPKTVAGRPDQSGEFSFGPLGLPDGKALVLHALGGDRGYAILGEWWRKPLSGYEPELLPAVPASEQGFRSRPMQPRDTVWMSEEWRGADGAEGDTLTRMLAAAQEVRSRVREISSDSAEARMYQRKLLIDAFQQSGTIHANRTVLVSRASGKTQWTRVPIVVVDDAGIPLAIPTPPETSLGYHGFRATRDLTGRLDLNVASAHGWIELAEVRLATEAELVDESMKLLGENDIKINSVVLELGSFQTTASTKFLNQLVGDATVITDDPAYGRGFAVYYQNEVLTQSDDQPWHGAVDAVMKRGFVVQGIWTESGPVRLYFERPR